MFENISFYVVLTQNEDKNNLTLIDYMKNYVIKLNKILFYEIIFLLQLP